MRTGRVVGAAVGGRALELTDAAPRSGGAGGLPPAALAARPPLGHHSSVLSGPHRFSFRRDCFWCLCLDHNLLSV